MLLLDCDGEGFDRVILESERTLEMRDTLMRARVALDVAIEGLARA